MKRTSVRCRGPGVPTKLTAGERVERPDLIAEDLIYGPVDLAAMAQRA